MIGSFLDTDSVFPALPAILSLLVLQPPGCLLPAMLKGPRAAVVNSPTAGNAVPVTHAVHNAPSSIERASRTAVALMTQCTQCPGRTARIHALRARCARILPTRELHLGELSWREGNKRKGGAATRIMSTAVRCVCVRVLCSLYESVFLDDSQREHTRSYAVGVGLQIFLLLLISACTFGVYQVVIPLTWTYKTTAGDACSACVYQYV